MGNKITLLYFFGDYCTPCKTMSKVIELFKNNYEVIKIDVEKEHEFTHKYMVEAIPTLIILKDGEEVKRFVGNRRESAIRETLNDIASEESD